MNTNTSKLKADAREIFAASIDAALPHQLVSRFLSLHGNTLIVSGKHYKVDHNVYVVGFGKAVIGMVTAVEAILGHHVRNGIASVPCGIQEALRQAVRSDLLPASDSRVTIMEGARNNLPDSDSQRAADKIIDLIKPLGKNDVLIVLVSGGGSALLPAPIPPITLQDMYDVSKVLALKGATISELNTIRKHLSLLKGGGLAKMAHPAQVIGLILPDIVGNRLDMIASGPTLPNNSSPQDCLDIITNRRGADDISEAVLTFLHDKVAMGTVIDESEPLPSNVLNICLGNNQLAAAAAVCSAEQLGYEALMFSSDICGEATDVAEMFIAVATYICNYHQVQIGGHSNQQLKILKQNLLISHGLGSETLQQVERVVDSAIKRGKPVCILGAGETTVTVTGTGKGGRNQEMTLAVAIAMHKQLANYNVVFLSGGTDGQDGPTDAAGALADPGQVTLANQSGLDAETCLKNNDSYSFYKLLNSGKDLLVTGLTGTNVMDIQILLISLA